MRLQVSRIRPAASTPATRAFAAKEGSRRSRSHRRTVEGVEMRTFGEKHVAHAERANTCLRAHAVLVLTAPAWLPVSATGRLRVGSQLRRYGSFRGRAGTRSRVWRTNAIKSRGPRSASVPSPRTGSVGRVRWPVYSCLSSSNPHASLGAAGFLRALPAKRARRAQGRGVVIFLVLGGCRVVLERFMVRVLSPRSTPGGGRPSESMLLGRPEGSGGRRLTGGQISRRFGRAGPAPSVTGTRRPAAAALRVWRSLGWRRSLHP